MCELIKVENCIASLDADTGFKLAEMERVIKTLTEQRDSLKERILQEMEAKNVRKIETDDVIITYKDSYDRESFQSKQFRSEHADLYDSYIKMTPVKASVSIKVKEAE